MIVFSSQQCNAQPNERHFCTLITSLMLYGISSLTAQADPEYRSTYAAAVCCFCAPPRCVLIFIVLRIIVSLFHCYHHKMRRHFDLSRLDDVIERRKHRFIDQLIGLDHFDPVLRSMTYFMVLSAF